MVDPKSSPEKHDQFLRLYVVHEPAVRGFVRSLLPTREDTCEVMQEVAVVLWRKFSELEQADDFRRWAFGVAKIEVMAWRRDRARDRLILNETAIVALAQNVEQRQSYLESQRDALEHCLNRLTPEHRNVLQQAYAENRRIDRIAAELGRSAMSLYKLLHRLRVSLVECTRNVLAREGLS